MGHRVDIAAGEGQARTAAALEVRTQQGTLFLVLEACPPDPAAAPVLHAALSSFVGTMACSRATAPPRMLDEAFDAANRAAHEHLVRNSGLGPVLVSAVAVFCADNRLHVASAGSNGAYLRSAGQTRALVEPETAAGRLVRDGITADPLPTSAEAAMPVSGLGLPPEIFSLRQNRSHQEPESYLLVLCGSAVETRITPAHIATISPAGDPSRTATRLYRQFSDRLSAPSVVLAAFRHGRQTDETLLRSPIPIEPPRRRLAALPYVAGALLVLAALVCFFLLRNADRGEPGSPPVAPLPTLLLPPKEVPDVTSEPQPSPSGPATEMEPEVKVIDFTAPEATPDEVPADMDGAANARPAEPESSVEPDARGKPEP